MARKPRIHYPGALYHVMVRGNNKEAVLLDDLQKNKYLSILARYKEMFDFKLYAFCIMDNHAHLLVEVNETPLSSIMQRIQQVYTQWYNYTYERTGHVFQQRYKALLCDKDSYLLQLVKYIHYNPVRSDLAGGINYPWSSHRYYSIEQIDPLVDTTFVLNMFSSDTEKAIVQYSRYLKQKPEDKDYKDIVDAPEMMQITEHEKPAQEDTLSLDDLIELICHNENISSALIFNKDKTQKVSNARKAIIILSDKYCSISNTKLAEHLNLAPSMTSRIKAKRFKQTARVKDIIKRFERGSSITEA